LIRSVIALFDGGTPKKFDATARFIFAGATGSLPAHAHATKAEHISIDADITLTILRSFTLDITRLLLLFRYVIRLAELNPVHGIHTSVVRTPKSFDPKRGMRLYLPRQVLQQLG
jgi:hypothetical protein